MDTFFYFEKRKREANSRGNVYGQSFRRRWTTSTNWQAGNRRVELRFRWFRGDGMGLTLRTIFTVGGCGPLYQGSPFMGCLRGWGRGWVSCAQRLALPMGLNSPFLYIAPRVCLRRSEHHRDQREEKENGSPNGPVSTTHPGSLHGGGFFFFFRRPSGFLLSLNVVNHWQTTRLLAASYLILGTLHPVGGR